MKRSSEFKSFNSNLFSLLTSRESSIRIKCGLIKEAQITNHVFTKRSMGVGGLIFEVFIL